ncbi:TIGR00269 family protein [Candidatus Woesearchaeota archaeon]|nr:TIGR00269 family protein [Candidatus Woesearchaeota archaeon]
MTNSSFAQFEATVKATIEQFGLITPDDTVVVAVSGGKDSTVMLHLLKKFGYDVKAVTVDTQIGCYTKKNLENIKDFCKQLGVPLTVVSYREHYGGSVCYVRDLLNSRGANVKSCTVCGVPRRQLINKAARELGATKVAIGHNLDDEACAVLMNLCKNRMDLMARLGPKSSGSIPGLVPRIKPLYFCSEADIAAYSKLQGFPVHYGRCPCSHDSFRNSMRELLPKLETEHPGAARRLVERLLEKLPALHEFSGKTVVQICANCGEPCKDKVCRTCQLMEAMKA